MKRRVIRENIDDLSSAKKISNIMIFELQLSNIKGDH